jgi:hypothetical protein
MDLSVREVLVGITTVSDMVKAFQDEDHCRRLLEAMVCPTGSEPDLGSTSARTAPAGFSSPSPPARPCMRPSSRFGCGSPASG